MTRGRVTASARRARGAARVRRRRAPDGPAAHGVDRRRPVPRGGPRVRVDRPGRARARGDALRAARRRRRPASRLAPPRPGRLPLVAGSPRRRAPTGPTRSIRHWLYDEAEVLRWQALATSTVDDGRGDRGAGAERGGVPPPACACAARRAGRRPRRQCAPAPRRSPRCSRSASRCSTTARPARCRSGRRRAASPALLPEWQAVGRRRASGAATSGTPSTRAAVRPHVRSPEFAEMYARMREVLMLDPTAHW